MTGPTPSFGSLGDVTEHAAETRTGVNRRIVRFIVIYALYLRRPSPRHRSACGGDATRPSLTGDELRITSSPRCSKPLAGAVRLPPQDRVLDALEMGPHPFHA